MKHCLPKRLFKDKCFLAAEQKIVRSTQICQTAAMTESARLGLFAVISRFLV